MEQVKITVVFNLPELRLSEKNREYLNSLIQEVLVKEGSMGLLSALEVYLGK